MPVHTIPAASIHEDLQQIQREGEVIQHIARKDRRTFVVVTTYPEARETRPALREFTHAARLGALEQRAKWDADPLLHSFVTDDIVRDGDA